MRIALRNAILKKVDDEAMRKVIEFRRYYTVIRERGGQNEAQKEEAKRMFQRAAEV